MCICIEYMLPPPSHTWWWWSVCTCQSSCAIARTVEQLVIQQLGWVALLATASWREDSQPLQEEDPTHQGPFSTRREEWHHGKGRSRRTGGVGRAALLSVSSLPVVSCEKAKAASRSRRVASSTWDTQAAYQRNNAFMNVINDGCRLSEDEVGIARRRLKPAVSKIQGLLGSQMT